MILLKGINTLFTGTEDIHDVDILIEGNHISRIEKDVSIEPSPDEPFEQIDCRDMVVIPGLVNTHHHFFQTLQRCLPAVQDSPLFDWLVNLYEVWKQMDDDSVYWSTLVACGELLKTGCTMTSDNLYVYPGRSSGKFADIEIEAAVKAGIRFHPTRGSMSRGRSAGGLPPDEVVQTAEEILEDSERLIATYHDVKPGAMIRIALGPCSPFSVSEDLLKQTRQLATRKGVLLHTHLAETGDENTYCLENYGVRPLELMERCGWLGPDVWFAHGIHFTDRELEHLKATDTGICHCPTSNMRLGSGVARVPEMVEMGIRMGLGVDGSASNDSSDMLGEVRNCFLLNRLGGSSTISARDAIKLATEGGASLLGRDDTGRLEPGKLADLVGIKVSTICRAGAVHDYTASLVLCGCDHSVDLNIVNGKVVVRDGRLLTIDEEEVTREANKAAKRLLNP